MTREKKHFETEFGYFSEDGREYVIKDFRTPKPWVNVISNGKYGLVISQIGGGFSWIDHANLNRLTRWQQDLIRDNWGKYFYIRDNKTASVWSPTVAPVMKNPDNYLCRHGIGYSIFSTEYHGIKTELRIVVPFGDDIEIWSLIVKNKSSVPRELSVFNYFEWCLGAAPDSHREFHKSFIETEFRPDLNAILARKRLWEIKADRGHWNINWDRTAFWACSDPIDAFECDKEQFLGQYGNLVNPAAIERGKLGNSQGKWTDPIASLQKNIVLEPNEGKEIHFILGAVMQEEKIGEILNKYSSHEKIEEAFKRVQKKWDEFLLPTRIETPDAGLNFLANNFLKYQTISGRLWGRAAYYQQSGAFGFRDQLQDSQVFFYSHADLALEQLRLHARHQFANGKVLHWWHPIIEEGRDGGMSDDLLWLPFITIQYLKETGNFDVLDEPLEFYDDKKKKPLLIHLLRAIDLSITRKSERGLPLILSGDWNDGLSGVGLDGKGESLWLAHFLYLILSEMDFILKRRGLQNKAKDYQREAKELKKAINEYGWDGEWFWRATKDSGELIGSRKNSEGKIYLNPQTWAVLAHVAAPARQQKALSSAEKYLLKDFGPLLFFPAYQKPDEFIGYLSRYAPGVRENGGVYTHAAIWMILAECEMGRCTRANEILRRISPIYNGLQPRRYMAEPYVTPGNIDGIESPYFGRGAWTWYTGSASWMLRAILDYIIGVRADYDGLRIKPCFPEDWHHVIMNRYFRGSSYHIEFKRLEEGEEQSMVIWMNGNKLEGNLIPEAAPDSQVDVLVRF